VDNDRTPDDLTHFLKQFKGADPTEASDYDDWENWEEAAVDG
jgi:hypothetical protein